MLKTANIQPIIEFNPKLPKLSASEKKVLKLLTEAAKLIVPIYKLQENPKFPGANFYPHDATKEEIEKVAKKDTEILSSYTVVERTDNQLVAVPYHIKYQNYLAPIAKILNEASRICENKEFAAFLNIQAEALIKGSYESAVIASLKKEQYILDIFIGPLDHDEDQLLSIKASYQAWVGVVEREGTERLNNYKKTILSSRKIPIPTERFDNYDKVKAKVLDVIVFSGLLAETNYVGINLPSKINIVEKYGSEITLFNQPNDHRMNEQIMPTFNRIFPRELREEFDFEDLRRANLRYIAMHELSHSYLYYRHAEENLKDLFMVIYELTATVLGFRMAGYLLLKDRINNKQLESMILAFLCRSFYLVEKQTGKLLTNYTLGSVVFINFLLDTGALKKYKNEVIPNFMKIFIALHDLFRILERILAHGTRKEVVVLIEKYGQTKDILF